MNLVEPVEFSGINLYDLRINLYETTFVLRLQQCCKLLEFSDCASCSWGKKVNGRDCNRVVTIGFLLDWMHDFQNKIPVLLEAGIPVLVYAGDQGFICNWLGNKAWTLALEWSGKDAFNKAEDRFWDPIKTNSR